MGSSVRSGSCFSALFALLCPDLIAGCEDLTRRAQRFAEGSSSLRSSALSLRLGVKNGAFGCGSAALRLCGSIAFATVE